MGIRRGYVAALAVAVACAGESAVAQQYVDEGGVRYEVTQQQVPTQVPVTEMQSRQQTTYRQQVTTENVQHQQVYHVPVTQYQVVSRLHNRWNPFAEPYWTHHYEPVTTWQQQVGTVQIPVNKVAVVPETRTVQQPVTTWKTVNNTITHRRAIGMTPTGPGGNTALASAQPTSSGASAALSPVGPGSTQPAASVASRPVGGQTITSDPPRYGTTPATSSGWQQAQPLVSQPAATTPAAPTQSRY